MRKISRKKQQAKILRGERRDFTLTGFILVIFQAYYFSQTPIANADRGESSAEMDVLPEPQMSYNRS